MKKLIIAITSAFCLLANNAMSMDLRPSVGISGNMALYAATGIENNYDDQNGSTLDETTKEYGAFDESYGSVFVELSVNDMLSVGVDYVPMTFDTPKNTSNEDQSNQNTVYAEFEDLTTVYAKLNLPLGGTYLKVGYSTVDVLTKEIISSGSTYGDVSTDGMTAGIGYAQEVSGGVSIRAEITGNEFSSVSTTNGKTTNKTEIKVQDMIGVRGTISLVKSF